MGLKARTNAQRLLELREENKDNPRYPKLKLIDDVLEVSIDEKIYKGTIEEMYNKFKNTPYFLEEYDDLINNENDFISYNMKIIEEQLKSKFD